MSLILRTIFGPSKQEVWRQLAEQVEGRFHAGGLLGSDVVQAASGDWIVTLDTNNEGDRGMFTRLRAPYVNPEGFRFELYRAGIFSGLGRWFGARDVEVGHPRLDARFVIKGDSEERLRRLFGNQRIRELVESEPRIHLQVRDDAGWFGERFPDGVDELHAECPGVVKSLARLENLFELFTEVLNQLCHEGRAYEDAVDVHVRRLEGPGGKVQGRHLLWDGDPARRDAAAALGRLRDPRAVDSLTSVLNSEDDRLRAVAIEALASISHRKAVGPLVGLLGDAGTAHGARIRDRAAEALRRLGEGDLVEAVVGGLDGDRAGLRDAVGAYRSHAIDAFVAALDQSSGAHAAAALAELGAVEALPALRQALRGWARGERGEAIEGAIRELEARSALPRPAGEAGAASGTLPRTVGASEGTPDDLPRPADEDGS